MAFNPQNPLTEKIVGTGLGLRVQHSEELIAKPRPIPWLEILADNYLGVGGLLAGQLNNLTDIYPIAFHCVGLSLGSAGCLDMAYVKQLKKLVYKHAPCYISDHLSWSNLAGEFSHDLFPLPYTEESFKLLTEKIGIVQNELGQQILLENISRYIDIKESDIHEAEFLSQLCSTTGCGILFDLNNLYVNHKNLNWDIEDYLQRLTTENIGYLHIAGHEEHHGFRIDTHGTPVTQEVLALYQNFTQRFGRFPTLLEWDNNLPNLNELDQHRIAIDSIQKNSTPQYECQPNEKRFA